MKLDAIQALRAIACTLVVVSHASATTNGYFGEYSLVLRSFLQLGVFGVDLFFIISGFVIIFAHQNDIDISGKITIYIRKRLVRIFVPYLPFGIAVALAASLGLVNLGKDWNWTSSLFLYPDLPAPALSVGWSLEHEMMFYSAFAFLIFSRSLGSAVLATWFAIIITSNTGIFYYESRVSLLVNIYFFIGVGIYYLLKHANRTFMAILGISCSILGILVSSAWFVFWILNSSDYMESFRLIEGTGFVNVILITGVFILFLSNNDILDSFSQVTVIRMIGDASYAIYLTHTIIIFLLSRLFLILGLTDGNVFMILATFVSLGAGVGVHVFMEKPTINYVNRVFARKSA